MFAILSAIWARRGAAPYLLLALFGFGLLLQHTKLREYRAEIETRNTELRSAAAANQDDQRAIDVLREANTRLTSSLDQERADAATAADTASRRARELQARLSTAGDQLAQLEKNPAYAPFLDVDLAALYPDLARGLRALDASGQD